MSYTKTTRDIADDLVRRLIDEHGGLHRVSLYNLRHSIEKQLDGYFADGTLAWGEKRVEG